jgi:hypothetical protein
MQPDTFRTLAEYIHELRRRDWNNYPTGEYPAFDTTIHENTPGDQGNRSGDAGRGKNTPR